MSTIVAVSDRTSVTSRRCIAVAAATFAIAWGGNEFTPLLVMYRTGEGSPR